VVDVVSLGPNLLA